MKAAFRRLGYQPWDGPQSQVVNELIKGRSRFMGLAWGRQSGKTTLAAHVGIATALTIPHSRGWIVAPSHKLVEKAFRMIWMLLDKHSIECRYRNWQAKHIELAENGSVIEGYSAENYKKSNVGDTLHWMIIDEVSQIAQDAWNLALKACLAVHQGWSLMIGTFDELGGWYYDLHEQEKQRVEAGQQSEWRMFRGATWDVNRGIFAGGLQDPKIQSERNSMPREAFLAQFGGLVLPNPLLVYREFRRDIHVRPCPYNAAWPVRLSVDQSAGGANPYAVVAVQDYGAEIRQIDEYYKVGVMAEEVVADLERKPWWDNVTDILMDSGPSPLEAKRWRALSGKKVLTIGDKPEIEERIPVVRMWLREPTAYNAVADAHRQEVMAERGWQHWEWLDYQDQLEVELLAMERVSREQLLGTARYFLDERCHNTITEMTHYKRKRTGDQNLPEAPLKASDHAINAIEYYLWKHKRNGPRRAADRYEEVA